MKLLYVDCCITVHGSASRTAALAETFLSAWRAAHPEADLETLDLKTLTLNPLLGNALCLRETLQSEGRTEGASFALARQFAAAERIVIAAPYWELSFPAQLRLYIEHIAAQGITFDYTSRRPGGPVPGGKAVVPHHRRRFTGSQLRQRALARPVPLLRHWRIPLYRRAHAGCEGNRSRNAPAGCSGPG